MDISPEGEGAMGGETLAFGGAVPSKSLPEISDSDELFHCSRCRKVFSCPVSMRKHVKKNADCDSCERFCREDHTHQIVQEEFDVMDEAFEWYYSNEIDRYITVISSTPQFKTFACNQRINHRKEFKKTKKQFKCPARFAFRRSEVCTCGDYSGELCKSPKFRILVYGCIAHSHPMEQNNFRLSKLTKDRIRKDLEKGLGADEIVKQFGPPEADPNSKPVLKSDVYRIAKSHNLVGKVKARPPKSADKGSTNGKTTVHVEMESVELNSLQEQDIQFEMQEEQMNPEDPQTITVTFEDPEKPGKQKAPQTILMDHELATLRVAFSSVLEKVQQIDYILASPDFNIEQKKSIMNALSTRPIQQVKIPPIQKVPIS